MSNYTTENIVYTCNNVTLEAFIARPETNKPNPAVLLCHAWSGRDKFVEDKAQYLATLGYVGVALDVYGKGKLAITVDEKLGLMQPLLDDRAELQNRLSSGLDLISNQAYVDKSKIIAIGFCFGGLCVLDMARMGLNLTGVISVHGLFAKPNNLSNYKIKSKVLALHGHLDPMVTPDVVEQFMHELDHADADWQLNVYGKALHAFTNPEANDSNLGTVYDKDADSRAWGAIRQFLAENLK
jgi:dienelactone hydrolase